MPLKVRTCAVGSIPVIVDTLVLATAASEREEQLVRADTLTLKTLFQKDVRYVIPSFQRPYVWTQEDQWEPLWDDVRNTAERYLDHLVLAEGNQVLAAERSASHFMGAVVLQQQPTVAAELEVRHVIDGQQRLTTAQLLMDAAQEALQEVGADAEASRMLRLVENTFATGDDKFKLWPTAVDQEAFRAAMTNAVSPSSFAKSQIVQAHDFFRLQVREWSESSFDQEERSLRAHALETALFGLLQFVVIDLTTADDAFVIFETLNARGTPLLASDLVKNYVLQTAALAGVSSDDVYETEWKVLDDPWWRKEVGQGRLTRPRVDVFLNYWLVMRTAEEVPPTTVFPSFKRYVENGQKVIDVAKDIRHVSATYRSFDDVDEYSAFGTYLYRWRTMDAGVTTPVLLWLATQPTDKLSESERLEALAAIESFFVRRMLCRMTTKDYNNLFLELLKRLHAAESEAVASSTTQYLAEQTAESRLWPGDDAVLHALLDLPLYRLLTRARLRMVLEAIEDALRSPKAEETHCPRRTLTIEHLMPQSWPEHWAPPAGEDELQALLERERLLHSLGNLTLVNDRLNPALSNASWATKRETLGQHTTLHLNKRLLAEQQVDWDETTIRDRSRALAELVVKVWPRPSAAH
jgi:hypothetical protein